MSKLLKKYFDISKFVIWGEGSSDDEGGKRPRLVFSFRDGNPRFTVYTGVMGAEGVIAFPCDFAHMVATMHLLKDIIAGPAGKKIVVASLRSVYQDNKPTKEKAVSSTLHAGKSKDGIIYFSLISENKPKIVFPIKVSPFHTFTDGDKNPIPDNIISEKMALGLTDTILEIIGLVMYNYSIEDYSGGKKQASTDPKNFNNNSTDNNKQTISNQNKEILQDLDDLNL